MNRTKRADITMTPDEHATLHREAALAQRPLARWMRETCLEPAVYLVVDDHGRRVGVHPQRWGARALAKLHPHRASVVRLSGSSPGVDLLLENMRLAPGK